MTRLSEDEQRVIYALRDAGFSKTATAEFVDRGKSSVENYEPADVDGYDEDLDKEWSDIEPALPDDVDPRDVLAEEFIPHDYGDEDDAKRGTDPYKDETDEEVEITDRPEDYTPGEFIEAFFDELEVSVKSQFVGIQSRRADRKGQVPDQERMLEDLEEMSSGVKGRTAKYVAEEYWSAMEDYLSETKYTHTGQNGSDTTTTTSERGGFVSANGQQPQQGGWVQMPDGSQRYGRMEQQPDGSMRFVPMQPPQGGAQPQMGQHPGGGQSREAQQLRDEIQRLRQEVNSGNSGGLKSQIQEMIELQDAVEQLSDRNSTQGVEVLQQELRALRQQMGTQDRPAPSDPKEAVMNKVMSSDELDPRDAVDILDRIEGQKDPEIRMKELEMEMEKEKMKQKEERTKSIMDSLDSLVETGAMTLAERLRQGTADSEQSGGGGQSPQQESPRATDGGSSTSPGAPKPNHQTQQPSAGAPSPGAAQPSAEAAVRPTQDWECPECGSVTEHPKGSRVKACEVCDFSRVPCPDCEMPVDIPPMEEADRGGCPECGEVVPADPDDDRAACINCEWVGDPDEALGDMIECENCGSEHPVTEGV